MNEKVSIITPVFNAELYVRQCVESVLIQSYENWEMIFCDDCSTDKSVDVIKEFAKKDTRIKLLSCETNSGAGVARNKAIEHAAGRYIAFLDCDDFWHEQKLEKQLKFLKQKDLGIVYSQYFIVEGNSNVPKFKINSPKQVTYNKMLCNDYIGFLTLLYDTEKIDKQYMPEIRRRQDWAYKLQLLKNNGCAQGIQEPLAYYRIGNSSLSSNKLKLVKYNFNIFKNELGYNWITSFFMMINFLVHYFYFKQVSKKKVNFNS